MKHLLRLSDLSPAEIIDVLNLADQLKFEKKHNIAHPRLSGKTLGMIFSKASTRTRVSFETGMYQLGGNALFLGSSDLQIERGEPIEDTAKVLSRFLDGIMIRTYKQSDVEMLASVGQIPIINGLTDYCHPCQVLADLMTIREYKTYLEGLKLCYVGDGNNMANSLIVGCIKTGMEISIACPNQYQPDQELMKWGKASGKLTVTDNIADAIADSDVVYTDVWASMGQEHEKAQREKVFKHFQVNDQNLSYAKHDCMVLHCLPAHRGEEITAEVMDKHQEIFDQAENRLHAQKAVLCRVMENN